MRPVVKLVRALGLGLGLLLVACATEEQEPAADDSDLSLSELGRLIQTYDSVRPRRPFSRLEEAKRAAEVPSVSEACPTSDPICRDIARAETLDQASAKTAYAEIRSALRTRVEEAIVAGDVG